MNSPTYRVDITRESGLWTAVVEGLPPGVIGATDVEHFAELKDEVRDLIAGLTDSTPADFHVEWRYAQNGRDYSMIIQELGYWDEQAAAAAKQRDGFRRAAIESMRSAGLSIRDIGDVLGLSHQRVHQLMSQAS